MVEVTMRVAFNLQDQKSIKYNSYILFNNFLNMNAITQRTVITLLSIFEYNRSVTLQESVIIIYLIANQFI